MGKTGSQSTPQNSVDFGTTFLKYYNERYSKTTLSKIDDFIDHFEKHGLFGPPAWIGKVSPSYKVPDHYPNKEAIEEHARTFALWHAHIGDPCFKGSFHSKYKVSDWVLHFQKISDNHIKLLELGYHGKPMALPTEDLINEP